MKNILFLILSAACSLLIANCSDDTTSPNQTETVVFELDSLVLYSDTVSQGDTILNYTERSSPVLNNPPLTGNKTCKVTFNSVTNDSTNSNDTAALLNYTIRSYTGVFPNQQFVAQLSDSIKGNSINAFYQNSVTVSINPAFGFHFYIRSLFRNRYLSNKYIKIYNIKVTHN
jgi:hypothetical protein